MLYFNFFASVLSSNVFQLYGYLSKQGHLFYNEDSICSNIEPRYRLSLGSYLRREWKGNGTKYVLFRSKKEWLLEMVQSVICNEAETMQFAVVLFQLPFRQSIYDLNGNKILALPSVPNKITKRYILSHESHIEFRRIFRYPIFSLAGFMSEEPTRITIMCKKSTFDRMQKQLAQYYHEDESHFELPRMYKRDFTRSRSKALKRYVVFCQNSSTLSKPIIVKPLSSSIYKMMAIALSPRSILLRFKPENRIIEELMRSMTLLLPTLPYEILNKILCMTGTLRNDCEIPYDTVMQLLSGKYMRISRDIRLVN